MRWPWQMGEAGQEVTAVLPESLAFRALCRHRLTNRPSGGRPHGRVTAVFLAAWVNISLNEDSHAWAGNIRSLHGKGSCRLQRRDTGAGPDSAVCRRGSHGLTSARHRGGGISAGVWSGEPRRAVPRLRHVRRAVSRPRQRDQQPADPARRPVGSQSGRHDLHHPKHDAHHGAGRAAVRGRARVRRDRLGGWLLGRVRLVRRRPGRRAGRPGRAGRARRERAGLGLRQHCAGKLVVDAQRGGTESAAKRVQRWLRAIFATTVAAVPPGNRNRLDWRPLLGRARGAGCPAGDTVCHQTVHRLPGRDQFQPVRRAARRARTADLGPLLARELVQGGPGRRLARTVGLTDHRFAPTAVPVPAGPQRVGYRHGIPVHHEPLGDLPLHRRLGPADRLQPRLDQRRSSGPEPVGFHRTTTSGTGVRGAGGLFLHGANLGLEARW